MATIKIPKKEFEKHIKLTDEIKEKISIFGTPLESITDNKIEIEIFPNRPDLLSPQGYIRGFLAFLGKTKGLKQYKLNKPEKNYEVMIDKSVEDIRPFTVCAIIKNLSFNNEKIKEVIDIQEKIHSTFGRNRKKIAIGIYPLEKIKLPIKYLAKKPDEIKFIPLEETREMTGRQILTRTSTGRQYAPLLQNKEKFPIFQDAEKNILSMPPVINSQLTGKINESTKDIFIECSGFDFDVLKKTLNILATMFADMGGKIYQMNLRYKKPTTTPNLAPEKLKLSVENTNNLLGLNLTEKQIKNCLEKMGYNYDKGEVEIPAWRTDILHEVDLIEDIAIAHGYENFKPEIPNISSTGETDKAEIKKRKIAEILAGLNLLETSSYHLTTISEQFKKTNIKKQNIIEVEDSKTEYNILRNNLMHYILKIFGENINAEYPQKIFELGRVFEKKENKITEKENLSVGIAHAKANFTEIKQILNYLLSMFNKTCTINPTEHPSFISGRCGEVIINKKPAGIIGEIKPSVLKNFHIKMPVSLFEIEIEEL